MKRLWLKFTVLLLTVSACGTKSDSKSTTSQTGDYKTETVFAQTTIKGYVVLDHYECKSSDHIVIETNKGYTIAEVYSGYSATHSGKVIYGDLHSYNFELIYNSNGDEIGKLWIEDYMVSKSRALKWCYEE